jgi:hypothetical protein
MTWYLQEKTIPRHADYQLSTPVDNQFVTRFGIWYAIGKETANAIIGNGNVVDGFEASACRSSVRRHSETVNRQVCKGK